MIVLCEGLTGECWCGMDFYGAVWTFILRCVLGTFFVRGCGLVYTCVMCGGTSNPLGLVEWCG